MLTSDSSCSHAYSAAPQSQCTSRDTIEHAHSHIAEYPNGNVENPHVTLLALDSDNSQTSGAEQWVRKLRNFERIKNRTPSPCWQLCELPSGDWSRNREQNRARILEGNFGEDERITHRTIHITPTTLLSSIDEWILSEADISKQHSNAGGAEKEQAGNPIPVLFVALHACGSLTPDIIRAFLSYGAASSNGTTGRKKKWIAAGVLVVGCCYNLLAPSGMPSYASLVPF